MPIKSHPPTLHFWVHVCQPDMACNQKQTVAKQHSKKKPTKQHYSTYCISRPPKPFLQARTVNKQRLHSAPAIPLFQLKLITAAVSRGRPPRVHGAILSVNPQQTQHRNHRMASAVVFNVPSSTGKVPQDVTILHCVTTATGAMFSNVLQR